MAIGRGRTDDHGSHRFLLPVPLPDAKGQQGRAGARKAHAWSLHLSCATPAAHLAAIRTYSFHPRPAPLRQASKGLGQAGPWPARTPSPWDSTPGVHGTSQPYHIVSTNIWAASRRVLFLSLRVHLGSVAEVVGAFFHRRRSWHVSYVFPAVVERKPAEVNAARLRVQLSHRVLAFLRWLASRGLLIRRPLHLRGGAPGVAHHGQGHPPLSYRFGPLSVWVSSLSLSVLLYIDPSQGLCLTLGLFIARMPLCAWLPVCDNPLLRCIRRPARTGRPGALPWPAVAPRGQAARSTGPQANGSQWWPASEPGLLASVVGVGCRRLSC